MRTKKRGGGRVAWRSTYHGHLCGDSNPVYPALRQRAPDQAVCHIKVAVAKLLQHVQQPKIDRAVSQHLHDADAPHLPCVAGNTVLDGRLLLEKKDQFVEVSSWTLEVRVCVCQHVERAP